MRDLIFVSLEDWDDIWRRNQFVCAKLARRHPGRRLLFVGLPRNALRHLRRGEWRALFASAARALPDAPNITVTYPWQFLPNRYAWSRRFNEWLVRRHVRRLARRLQLDRPLLWLNPHDALHLIGALGESAVIYDVTDDWTLPDQPAAKRELTVRQDAELCRRAAAVIVCSEALLRAKRTLSGNVHLIPNGVDAAHYAGVGTSEAWPATTHWPRPVLGYTGTLHSERIDVELVRRLAGLPGVGSVVMIGPNHLPPAEVERLRLPNVFLPGPVAYAQLPGFMGAFDACIVPHRLTPFTESLNPIKLWEYLAAGKPILSTPVAGFRDFPRLVYLADDFRGFGEALGRALEEDPSLPAQRRTEAGRHSWDARVDAIEAVLSACERDLLPPNADTVRTVPPTVPG